MIAKIGRGKNIVGALTYNQCKVDRENGSVLMVSNMMETLNGKYTVNHLNRSFEPFLAMNRKTEKPVLHISINPDPKDTVNDDDFRSIASEYMEQMGYGNQPFVVFKHNDIERVHIHIVSVCINPEGRKISDRFEKRRSMEVCRNLEKQYGLATATEKKNVKSESIFKPVDYTEGKVKSNIASVVRYLPQYYSFQSLGSYNALLSLFNIHAEEIKGGSIGKSGRGLVYSALNSLGEKTGIPFKSSLFGKSAGLDHLTVLFEKSKTELKNHPSQSVVREIVSRTLKESDSEDGFRELLIGKGINAVIRRNTEGRIYGITFIDHSSKTVWNGSMLDKSLSANVFDDLWNTDKKDISKDVDPKPRENTPVVTRTERKESPHPLFNFLDNRDHFETGTIEALGGLLPEAQGESPEELAFENEIKKKKRKKFNRQ